MRHDVFAVRRQPALDECEHCGRSVHRVWLVPGDVLDSCGDCYREATGREPVHAQGHSTVRRLPDRPRARPAASFPHCRAG
jgi:ribosome-binding protein aMBF1 (putative translation factor)